MLFFKLVKKFDKDFWLALALLVGTIVGVGMFSLPYIALQTSFLTVVFYFLIISGGVILIHHFYAEIGVHSQTNHHLPGYAEIYIGRWAKHLTLASESIGLFGAQLAYLLVGGSFLARIFQLAETAFEPLFVGLFFIFGAILIWRGIKSVVKTEFIMICILALLVIAFFIYSLFQANVSPLDIGWGQHPWLPYGAVIFSLWGLAAVPELNTIFHQREQKINKVILWGIIISGLIYLLFIWSVLSLSGTQTSPESLAGLLLFIPPHVVKLALVFGVITTFTSFLAIGLALKRMFYEDYNLSDKVSFFVAMTVPLMLYIIGFDSFLKAISISGSIGLTISGAMIYLIYFKIKKISQLKVAHNKFFTHNIFIIFMMVLTIMGALFSIYFQVFGT